MTQACVCKKFEATLGKITLRLDPLLTFHFIEDIEYKKKSIEPEKKKRSLITFVWHCSICTYSPSRSLGILLSQNILLSALFFLVRKYKNQCWGTICFNFHTEITCTRRIHFNKDEWAIATLTAYKIQLIMWYNSVRY